MVQSRCTPLHLAVKAGRLQTVLALLEVKEVQATVNYQDKVIGALIMYSAEFFWGLVECTRSIL